MKAFKKVLLGLGIVFAVATPLVIKDTEILSAYAVDETQVEEPTTPPTEPTEPSVPTEPTEPPVIEEDSSSSEEQPPVEPSEPTEPQEPSEPTEPEVPPFEKQTYTRKADDTHYEQLVLETQERFTMTYYAGVEETIVKGTYTLDGNNIKLVADEEYADKLRNDKLVLANNGTFQVYLPNVNDEDFGFTEVMNYLFTQAWFYLPVILAFMLTIAIPTIVKMCQIFSNSKTSARANKKVADKTNEIVSLSNSMSNYMNSCMKDDLAYWKAYRETITNKKQLAVVDERIAILENRIATIGQFNSVVEIKADELTNKVLKQEVKEEKKAEKVKVRVKIVDGE